METAVMQLKRILMLSLALTAGALLCHPAISNASPSGALAAVLSNIRSMLSIDTGSLVKWAKSDAPRPENPVFTLEKTEAAILDLDGPDRDAVLKWLRGDGRSALHDRGASDSDIGPAHSGIDAASAVAPAVSAWRNVPLASTTIGESTQEQIQILGGFAAVKKDGKGAIVCVSFKNVGPRVAKRVVFEFPFIGETGQTTGTLVLDRSGEFAPNVGIMSFGTLQAWQAGTGPHGQNDGCIGSTLPTAALPFLQAQAVGYHVKQVEYADSPATAAPAPSAHP
jgi:hypothetical protein